MGSEMCIRDRHHVDEVSSRLSVRRGKQATRNDWYLAVWPNSVNLLKGRGGFRVALTIWRYDMPKVGKKHYAYTPAGRRRAAAEAKRTGKKVMSKKKKK